MCLVILFSLVWMLFGGNGRLLFIMDLYCRICIWVFVRLTPMVLYRVVDFDVHNRLTGRYLGNILAYSVFGSLACLLLGFISLRVYP